MTLSIFPYKDTKFHRITNIAGIIEKNQQINAIETEI